MLRHYDHRKSCPTMYQQCSMSKNIPLRVHGMLIGRSRVIRRSHQGRSQDFVEKTENGRPLARMVCGFVKFILANVSMFTVGLQ